MKLLISNDDGIFAQGIRRLANALAAAGHHVSVVCPDSGRSATGHGPTLPPPLRAELIESIFHPPPQRPPPPRSPRERSLSRQRALRYRPRPHPAPTHPRRNYRIYF